MRALPPISIAFALLAGAGLLSAVAAGEPFLIQSGFLDRTPRGRVATRLAWEHFGIAPRTRPLL